MIYEDLVREYLAEFQRDCRDAYARGVTSVELPTRPVVTRFVKALVDLAKQPGADVAVGHDTSATRTNRPDWTVEDRPTFGIYCYGDHKSLEVGGAFVLNSSQQDQIKSYHDLGYPVFVFDGIEFLFFKDDFSNPTRAELIPKPVDLNADWSVQPVDSKAEYEFRDLLRNPGSRKWSETDLIRQLALRARLLARDLHELLEAPLASGSNASETKLLKALHNLRDLIAEHHDPSLYNAQGCADFIAQVLTFGLFYAHTRCPQAVATADERRSVLESFWRGDGFEAQAKALRPFKAIDEVLGEALQEGSVGGWRDDVIRVLSHAEYVGTTSSSGPKDFHALFEEFFKVFDPRKRFDFGVFVTPTLLTEWTVRAVDAVSILHFGRPMIEAADRIIDPCCGTGGFLEAIVASAKPTDVELPLLIGFEILPAPYALAQYRLTEVCTASGYLPPPRIYLTDTLADQLLAPPVSGVDGFSAELADAAAASKPPLRVVIGNPPATDTPAGRAPRTVIEGLVDDWRPQRKAASGASNVKQALSYESYRFLRWACDRVIASRRGIVALVLPGALAEKVSFRPVRKWLLEQFQHIYVLEFDGDARTGAATPSLFNVQQGRLVLLAVLEEVAESQSGPESPGESTLSGPVHHLDITRWALGEKTAFLTREVELEEFGSLTPTAPEFRFSASASYEVALWAKSWPLIGRGGVYGVFRQKSSGVKCAPTSLLFHTSLPILQRRSGQFNKLVDGVLIAADSLVSQWYPGPAGKKPTPVKLTPDVRAAVAAAATEAGQATPYLLAPFLRGWLLDSKDLWAALGRASGDGTRSRPPLRAAFKGGASGIVVAPAPKDVGAVLTRFVCFTRLLPDNDVAARGNGMVYCDRFPQADGTGSKPLVSNIEEPARALFAYSAEPDQECLHYVYCVMSSSVYLDAFNGVLYGSADPGAPARVPFVASEADRRALASLGRSIADCEDFEIAIELLEGLEVEWPTDAKEFRLVDYVLDEEAGTLTLTDGSGTTATIRGIPGGVLSLSIAGYDIVKQWLRERSYDFLHREFKLDDARELLDLLSRIERQLQLIEDVDQLLGPLLQEGKLEAPPTRGAEASLLVEEGALAPVLTPEKEADEIGRPAKKRSRK